MSIPLEPDVKRRAAAAPRRDLGERSRSFNPRLLEASRSSSRRSLLRKKNSQARICPELYRQAKQCQWDRVTPRLMSHAREATYVDPIDGTTALHLAVMSRACPNTLERLESCGDILGGTASSSLRMRPGPGPRGAGSGISAVPPVLSPAAADVPAPIDTIRALLLANPDATSVRCKRHGYTPLAYACLVPPRPPPSAPEAPPSASEATLDPEGSSSGAAAREGTDAADATSTTNPAKRSIYRDMFQSSSSPNAPPRSLTLDDAEELAQLLLHGHERTASILSWDGLSPLEVHVISYSRTRGHEGAATEGEGGRTTTGVLRALLQADPNLSRSCPPRVGPLELLFKHNAPAFLEALAREDAALAKRKHARLRRAASRRKLFTAAVTSSAIVKGGRLLRNGRAVQASGPSGDGSSCSALFPEKSDSVKLNLGSWWVWKWTILLLKYATITRKERRGMQFKAVHAAASTRGCPLPILMLTIRAFPAQLRERNGVLDDGNLPLHLVAGWGRKEGDGVGADAVSATRLGMVLSALLTEYQKAAQVRNGDGKLPLILALESNVTWDSGIRRLVNAYPEAAGERDVTTGLYPFMIASIGSGPEEESKAPATRMELKKLRTAYELLRCNPLVLAG